MASTDVHPTAVVYPGTVLGAGVKVLESAVVGKADGDGLVKAHAFVVLKNASDASPALVEDLKAFAKARLAPYKVPRVIDIVPDLPKTATGKIQRFRLR